MIIRRNQFAEAYSKIRKSCLSGTCAVLVLVSIDADALCACKMLAYLFRNDFVSYQIRPIAGWSDLEEVNTTLVNGNDSYLEVEETVKIYIIDSHRPVLLENCYLESNVMVWDDGDLEKQTDVQRAFNEWHEEDRRRKEQEDNNEEDIDDNEDDHADGEVDHLADEEDDQNTQVDDAEPVQSRKRRSRSGSSGTSGDDVSESDMSDSGPRQRRKTSPNSHIPPSPRPNLAGGAIDAVENPRAAALELKRRHDKNGGILSDYYDRGDYYRESVSGLIYGLASDLGREDNDLLWFAIVGLTSMAVQSKVTPQDYALYYSLFKDEVVRLNPPPLVQNKIQRANGRTSNDSSIRPESEYRFMLYRHWSLYDAMLHSPYLGAKMKIYSEPGKKQLHKLFAKMGFSLAQCRQVYTHMDLDLKKNLREKLKKFAPQYGLDELSLESFVRAYGYKCTLSASDTSYAITALLETGHKGPLLRSLQEEYTREETGTMTTEDTLAEIREEWLQNFNDAFDALNNIDLLQNAIQVSMNLHQAIVRTGTALIDKREIRSLKSFRMAVVKEGPDISIFTHPLALSKLASWISEAINESEREKGKTKHLPFVIAALNERTDRYLVLGTSVTNTTHSLTNPVDGEGSMTQQESRNKFGNAFQALSASHQARFRLDSFDASVVECNKADLGQLLETLSLQVLT